MTSVTTQEVLVFVTVSLASLYLVIKLFGPARRKKKRGAPDVPVSALLRKKRGGAPSPAPPGSSHGPSGGCH